jgi:cyanophycinase
VRAAGIIALMNRLALVFFLCLYIVTSFAQGSRGPGKGHLVISGGDWSAEALERFVMLAGGPDARIVVIPTAASAIKLPSNFIHYPDSVHHNERFARELALLFKVNSVSIFHTRDRNTANDAEFSSSIREADGVWIGPGNSGRLAEAYLNTAVDKALHSLLANGKVIGGNSAGAIIQGSFIVRGRPDKPLLMPDGRTTGFGFLKNVVINPHVISAKRENELVDVTDAHPNLLGIGLDDNSTIVVTGDEFELIGPGKAAIYENKRVDGRWYYWLNPGDRFNIPERRIIR